MTREEIRQRQWCTSAACHLEIHFFSRKTLITDLDFLVQTFFPAICIYERVDDDDARDCLPSVGASSGLHFQRKLPIKKDSGSGAVGTASVVDGSAGN